MESYTDIHTRLSLESKICGVIFDVDGTLYNQTAVRFKMARRLARYYLIHPAQWRSLYGIYIFRRIREKCDLQDVSFESQIEIASKKAGIQSERLQKAIQKWMFEEPLDLIQTYRLDNVIGLLESWQQSGCTIIIYSDYDPRQKLTVLNIQPDYTFFPDGRNINELKPSQSAMEFIVSKVGLQPNQMLYIGDRHEKDGKSAQIVGMQYIDVKQIK